MIEQRILEILKTPELISENDLPIFEKEIRKFPYIQNLRAAYLLGIHKFKPENYQSELSTTAAYTTDKKILYFLINKEENITNAQSTSEVAKMENLPISDSFLESKIEIPEPQTSETIQSTIETEKQETQETVNINEESCEHNPENCSLNRFYNKKAEELKHTVFIDGERNRILFEGEENFMQNQNIEGDDSNNTTKTEQPNNTNPFLAPETEKNINTEVQDEKSSDINSNYPIKPAESELEYKTTDIENFEIAASTIDKPQLENSTSDADISFHTTEEFMPTLETKSFSTPTESHYQPPIDQSYDKYKTEMDRLIAEVEEKIKLNKTPKVTESDEPISHEINFHEIPELLENKNSNITTEPIERPELSVSFLNPTVEITPQENPEIETSSTSNIPVFINTWHNWLKIDRNNQEKIATISIDEIKAEAIDKFIENEPKISPLKTDVEFVVKERSNDISHLMTETLANLYVEQRLYSKAINAFEILKEKFPEKIETFETRIKEIKELKSGGQKGE